MTAEVEISFDDLYERAEEDYRETYRADIPGTVEYDRKREAAQVEQTAAEAAEDTNAAEQDAEQTTETACKGEETAGEDGTLVLDRNQRRAYNPVVVQQRVQANFRRRAGREARNGGDRP